MKTFIKNWLSRAGTIFLLLFKKISTIHWKAVLTSGAIVLLVGYIVFYINLKRQDYVFKYTHLPDELIKQGYTEAYIVNQIAHIRFALSTYVPEVRDDEGVSDQKNPVTPKIKKFESISSEQMETIEHLEIGGISIKALIVITDKFVGLVADTDNYLTLEFTKAGENTLHLTITLAGSRFPPLEETYTPGNVHRAIASLNVQTAKLLMQKYDPSSLIEYYYNRELNLECQRSCRQALFDFSDDQIRADAYGYLALCLYDYSDYCLQLLKKAAPLDIKDKGWKILLAIEKASRCKDVAGALDSLVVNESKHFTYHMARFNYHREIDRDSVVIPQKYDTLVNAATKAAAYSSTIHFYYGQIKNEWAQTKNGNKWLDGAIAEYWKAINREMTPLEHKPNAKLLSNYYNNLAFCFELKVLNTYKECGELADGVKEKEISQYGSWLDSCYLHVNQALQLDPSNKWANSTLAEYYGLVYLLNPDLTDFKTSFRNRLSRAIRLGFTPSDWNTPPYCLLKKDSAKMLQNFQNEDGQKVLEELRLLNLLADSNP